MSNKKVVIVTPVFNRRDLTLQCLKSLTRIDRTGLDIHIIVADDASTDGTPEAIKEDFPDVEVLHGKGDWWFVGGANRGFERALAYNPDYILLINDDTVFDDKFLQYLVETAEANPRSAIGSLLLLWDTPHRVFQVAPQFDIWYGGWRHLHKQTVWTMPKHPFEVDFIAGNCILFPAEVFREIGLMDEKRFPQYADAEYTPRIKKKGWKLLIDPRARVFNQPNSTTSLSKMTLSKAYKALWGDLHKQQNLRTRWMLYQIAAPTKFHAAAAWVMHVIRLFSKPLGFNKKWETSEIEWGEKPLNEEYRSA